EYDLSKVMFICTANVLHTVPAPLKDRMEVISLSGYTLTEKLAIAQQFLTKKQLEKHGLEAHAITFEAEPLRQMIEMYTREAGVRSLEREIAAVARKLARKVLQAKPEQPLAVTPVMVGDLL